LYAEQPKQGQFRLPCGYGWWQEKENWLIARMKLAGLVGRRVVV
jgi:hypothetical protein